MPIYKMKGKKDGLQKYRVRINFKDANGADKQIDRVAYGMDAAKELERQLTREKKEAPTTSENMTVQELYDEYIVAKKYEVRETSLSKTESVITHHVLPTMQHKRLNKLTPPALQKWKTEIEKKSLTIRMRKNIYAEFRTLLSHAVKMGYVTANPLSRVDNFKDAYETVKSTDYYTADEFLSFIKIARRNARVLGDLSFEWNYYVFFAIAFFTGVRKGENYSLKWSDIDGDSLHIRRSIAQNLKGDDRETPPKNKSSYRTLQIPEPLKAILEEHKQRQRTADGFSEDWRICGGAECLRDTTVCNRNEQYASEAGVKKIRLHDYRHSHASLLANESINIQEIARRLGHSKIEITWNTYSHLYPREEERAVSVLNKIKIV